METEQNSSPSGQVITTSSGTSLKATSLTDLVDAQTIGTRLSTPRGRWDWGTTYEQTVQSEQEIKEKQDKLFEMQKAVFDSDIESEMKIKIISFIGKYAE